jgi:hypothetical protein
VEHNFGAVKGSVCDIQHKENSVPVYATEWKAHTLLRGELKHFTAKRLDAGG